MLFHPPLPLHFNLKWKSNLVLALDNMMAVRRQTALYISRLRIPKMTLNSLINGRTTLFWWEMFNSITKNETRFMVFHCLFLTVVLQDIFWQVQDVRSNDTLRRNTIGRKKQGSRFRWLKVTYKRVHIAHVFYIELGCRLDAQYSMLIVTTWNTQNPARTLIVYELMC
jgi:hypothetical protein